MVWPTKTGTQSELESGQVFTVSSRSVPAERCPPATPVSTSSSSPDSGIIHPLPPTSNAEQLKVSQSERSSDASNATSPERSITPSQPPLDKHRSIERFHRTLKDEWACIRPYTTNHERVEALTTGSTAITTSDPTPASEADHQPPDCEQPLWEAQLVDVVEDIAGMELERQYKLNAPRGVSGRNSDNTLIEQYLGWSPAIKLREGTEKTNE